MFTENRKPESRTLCAALFFVACAAAPGAAHDTEPRKNQVSFRVETSREVSNDWATALIGVSEEDSDAARLADRVNQVMRWGLDTAKQAKAVEVQSGGYQTHPVHDKGKIVRWRASQDLVLESKDVDALSDLLGKLQSRLLLRGITFSVSPESRRKVEDELVSETLAAFQKRAQRVQSDLGARDHALVSLSIHTPGGNPRPVRAQMSMARAEVATPAFESGQSTLGVSVDATIELEF